jgi:L-alanine-DL-glutamate epimerase-like enolase superfamily enzyme
MKIVDVELLRLAEPLHDLRLELAGRCDRQQRLLVRVALAGGIEGYGELLVAWPRERIAARGEWLARALVGRMAYDFEELAELGPEFGDEPILGGVDAALWDAWGRALRAPVCHLLGGEYRLRISIGIRLGARGPGDSPEDLARAAAEHVDRGIRHVQLLVAGDPNIDRAIVQAVTETLGSRATVHVVPRVPAGSGAPQDAPLGPLRVVAGEAGLLATKLRIAAAARDGRDVVIDCPFTAGPGLAAVLQLAACTPGASGPVFVEPAALYAPLAVDPWDLHEGQVTAPLAPGLGVELDRKKLERLAEW